jgi:ABC-type branched-subunit amino acid transport system substrate-binding protein
MMRALALTAAVAVVLAACGRSDDDTGTSTTSSAGPQTTAAASTTSATFGTLKDVCQEGKGGGDTAPGVTSDSIRIATFSDVGAAVRPGLNQELFDSADVFADWCNANGGINGRKIDVLKEDAALFDYQAKMVDACQKNTFFIVGGGAAFDDTGEKTRLECLLPSVPGYVASAQARDGELLVQPVPNPTDAIGYGQYRWLKKEFPDAVDKVGVLTAQIPTTQTISDQAVESAKALGFKTVYSDLYPAAGTVSWTPYVAAMKDKGVKGLIFTGEPGTLAELEKTMSDQGYKPDWITGAANLYDKGLTEIGGPAIDNTYIVTTFTPFEDAKSNPSLQQYENLYAKYKPNGKSEALLGAQGFSAWLLFAQAAKECGADLTRRCVYDNLKKVHDWTGGGLHATTDPGAGTPSDCYALIEATPDGFELAKIPTTDGIYNCSPDNVYKFKKSYGTGVKLGDVGKTLNDLK